MPSTVSSRSSNDAADAFIPFSGIALGSTTVTPLTVLAYSDPTVIGSGTANLTSLTPAASVPEPDVLVFARDRLRRFGIRSPQAFLTQQRFT
jgi:hypothetical protein